MTRHVRGILFVDYVRMVRAQKVANWQSLLHEEDLPLVHSQIDDDAWYPMATFERLGNAILAVITRSELFPVRLWGRYSAVQLAKKYPMLLDQGDPAETLSRFRVLRQTFFDFEALEVPLLHDDEAHVVIRYHMGMPAEEAAAHQTMGFFEGLLDLAGGQQISSEFREKSWIGEARTRLELKWKLPNQSKPQ